MKTEMELNITINTKQSFLPEHNRLKKFTIPKRTPDKDFLTECPTNQRDYNEVKERLTQSCFDTECNLESLWHFDKIEMVHNKDLEEAFVAKRSLLRDQGRMDKESSGFLVVFKDEVLRICQSGLCTSNSIKKELDIMKELGNPQLGVYLFKHVDIALNYASKYSVPVENIIIFRVILGKVKKIQPSKSKKKVALDPTPNFDCHVSRIHPSLKDTIEDQAIGSLIYFYEYSELSKPVDKPRQCLPHAVVKVKCINQKERADSLKYKPKSFSKGRGRGLPLENCTIVTRIGNSKLIYEHFHKSKNSAVNDNVSVEACSAHGWSSVAETQDRKMKPELLGQWDSAQTDAVNFQHAPNVDCGRHARSDHMGRSRKNPKDTSFPDPLPNYSELSTIITSKSIKDPRLTKKGKNLGEQNGEQVSHGISLSESKLKCKTETKISATLGIPRPAFSQEQYMAKMPWKERISREHWSPLNRNGDHLVNNEHDTVNVDQFNTGILDSQNINTDLAVKTSHSWLKSAHYGIQDANQILAERDEKAKYSKSFHVQAGYKMLDQNENNVNTNSVVSSYISNSTYNHNKEQPFQISTCNPNFESVAAYKGEMKLNRIQDDGYSSEAHCSASLDLECFKNQCTSKGDSEMLQSCSHKRMHLPGKSIMNENPKNTNRQMLALSDEESDSIGKKENTSKKLEEHTDNIKDWMDMSHILDSENSASDFNLNFQDKCSLAESQLMKIDGGKVKMKDLHDQALLTKCTSLTTDLTTQDDAFILITCDAVPLGSVKNTEVKHPQSGDTFHSANGNFGALNNSLSCNYSMPEIFEQELAAECRDINTPDLEVNSKSEILSEGFEKCVSVPQKLYSREDVASEETNSDYQYLQERMDWESLQVKLSPNIEISGSSPVKEDKNECSYEGKIDVGKITKLFNIPVRPDLQITVANTLYTHHSSFKMKTEIGEVLTKCSEQQKDIKWSQEEENEKYKLDKKKSRLYHRKNTHCSAEMSLPLLKGQFKTFEQSERHIKNVLHSLNTRASLHKNKYLSRKINGVMFDLQKAQRSVQKHLKDLVQTGKKKRNDSSKSHKILLSNFFKSSDHASYNDMSVQKMATFFTERKKPKIKRGKHALEMREAGEKTNYRLERHIDSELDRMSSTTCLLNKDESHSGSLYLDPSITSAFISDTPHNCNNRTVGVIDFETSENSTSLDTLDVSDMKSASNECRINNEQKSYANVVSGNNIQKHLTPFMGMQELSSYEASKNIKKCLNLAVVTKELSIYHADSGEDEDACEFNVQLSTDTSVQKESGKLNSSKPNAISKLPPIFSGKDTFSNEKASVEISPAQQKNINMRVDTGQMYALPYALVPVAKYGHNARDPLLIHGSGLKTKTNNSSKRNLEKICSEKQVEQQELYENKILKTLAKPIIQPDNKIERVDCYLTQTTSQVTPRKESANRQTSPTSAEKVIRCYSALPLSYSEQGCITTARILPCAPDDVVPNKNNQKFRTPESTLKDRGLSGEHLDNYKDITSDTELKEEIEQTSLDFLMKMSEILQKADETLSLNVLLQEQVVICKKILPFFIRTFEEKQNCSFEHVLVLRENAEKSIWAKLKPCALDSFVNIQIIMEIIEFIKNKSRYLQGKRTVRSLLWYDDSLCIELFGGQSGYQQQTNFYPAFQMRLKYNALNELRNHHKKLLDKLETLDSKSYYCLLKLKREIKECESAMKSNSLLSEFFLSEPYICGANYGDTIEELENARKDTVNLINRCRTLSGIPLNAEKTEHFGIMIDIISTKINFIRTCEEGNIKSSFIGLEHIFFNAAVNCTWRERSTFMDGDCKNGEGQMLKIYKAALPKLYEIYKKNSNCASEELCFLRKCAEEPCNYENDIVSYPDICIGEILDEAQSVNLDTLQQHLCKCTEHLEILKRYFQVIQKEDELITKQNVLNFLNTGVRAIRLKPEAVEVYTDLAMLYETINFLQNSIARKEDKPRFRSLLWFDLSLWNELLQCQVKMASFCYRRGNLLEMIESAISDIQDELNVVYDYAESLNCSYALQLLTREHAELLQIRKYLETSASSICMCVDLVPYTIAVNYGTSITELEYNYEQFNSLLEKLMLADRKDLGKMAHVMKILKTIEHMKFICTEQQKPPLSLVICQMLKNWRKSHQLKRQGDMRRHVDANGSNSTNRKRPACLPSEDNSYDQEENDASDSKKKKVVASLMTTKKKQEKETHRHLRKDARPNPFEREDLQLRIASDNTWNKEDEGLGDRPSLSPSHSRGWKAGDPLDYIEFSPNVSSSTLVHSNMSNSQEKQTGLKDFNENRKGCSKENKQECFAACEEKDKGVSISSKKDTSPRDPLTSKLSGDSSVLSTLNQHHDLKGDVSGKATTPLELDGNGEPDEKRPGSNCVPAYNSDSSAILELNKFMELEPLCSDPCSTANTQTFAVDQNEHIEEIPCAHSYSVHACRTSCPSYSWNVYHTGSNCHQVTQTYQEFSSYEMQHLTPTLTATSMVYNTQSSMFYSQSCHFGMGESQRFYFAQTYPMYGYFSSMVPFPYSYQPWPSWSTERHPSPQAAFQYSSNTGL